MGGKKKTKASSLSIGRRTGLNLVAGKHIRKQDDGIEKFDDYFSDSESIHSDQTNISKNSFKNRSERLTVSPIEPLRSLRSSLKKPVNEKNEDYSDNESDSSSMVSKRKTLTFLEDIENATIGRSKMTQTSHLLDQTENSPLKNRSNSEEVRKNKAYLHYSEKNSLKKPPKVSSKTLTLNQMGELPSSMSLSQERESEIKTKLTNSRSPPNKQHSFVSRSRVLSNSSSLKNIQDKGNHATYSEDGPSQHAAKSFEVQNEMHHNRYDESLNGSPIAVLKNCQEYIRKSDGKSPIEMKRKRQIPNELESRLLKSPRIQSRLDEGNKRNSSRGMSTRHESKSREVLNQTENIPSSCDKSINESESLVSSPKENGINVTEKSPRSIKQGIKQRSNVADSLVKVVKPVHSAKRKIVFSDATDNVVQDEPPPLGPKRSSRMRFPPLASWRNERLKYEKTSSGEIKCVGIDKGRPEDDFAYRLINRKLYKNKGVQKPKASKEKKQKIVNKKTIIRDANTGKTVELNLHRFFSTCKWVKPMNDKNANFLISRTFTSPLVSFGFLDIAAHGVKDEQFSMLDNVHFVVLKGVVDAVIAKSSFTFHKGDSFIVPIGTGYSLSNNTSSNVLLNYCAFKIPFYKHQANYDQTIVSD